METKQLKTIQFEEGGDIYAITDERLKEKAIANISGYQTFTAEEIDDTLNFNIPLDDNKFNNGDRFYIKYDESAYNIAGSTDTSILRLNGDESRIIDINTFPNGNYIVMCGNGNNYVVTKLYIMSRTGKELASINLKNITYNNNSWEYANSSNIYFCNTRMDAIAVAFNYTETNTVNDINYQIASDKYVIIINQLGKIQYQGLVFGEEYNHIHIDNYAAETSDANLMTSSCNLVNTKDYIHDYDYNLCAMLRGAWTFFSCTNNLTQISVLANWTGDRFEYVSLQNYEITKLSNLWGFIEFTNRTIGGIVSFNDQKYYITISSDFSEINFKNFTTSNTLSSPPQLCSNGTKAMYVGTISESSNYNTCKILYYTIFDNEGNMIKNSSVNLTNGYYYTGNSITSYGNVNGNYTYYLITSSGSTSSYTYIKEILVVLNEYGEIASEKLLYGTTINRSSSYYVYVYEKIQHYLNTQAGAFGSVVLYDSIYSSGTWSSGLRDNIFFHITDDGIAHTVSCKTINGLSWDANSYETYGSNIIQPNSFHLFEDNQIATIQMRIGSSELLFSYDLTSHSMIAESYPMAQYAVSIAGKDYVTYGTLTTENGVKVLTMVRKDYLGQSWVFSGYKYTFNGIPCDTELQNGEYYEGTYDEKSNKIILSAVSATLGTALGTYATKSSLEDVVNTLSNVATSGDYNDLTNIPGNASSEDFGLVKVDGDTIKAKDGVIYAENKSYQLKATKSENKNVFTTGRNIQYKTGDILAVSTPVEKVETSWNMLYNNYNEYGVQMYNGDRVIFSREDGTLYIRAVDVNGGVVKEKKSISVNSSSGLPTKAWPLKNGNLFVYISKAWALFNSSYDIINTVTSLPKLTSNASTDCENYNIIELNDNEILLTTLTGGSTYSFGYFIFNSTTGAVDRYKAIFNSSSTDITTSYIYNRFENSPNKWSFNTIYNKTYIHGYSTVTKNYIYTCIPIYDYYRYNSTSTAQYASALLVLIYDKNTLEQVDSYVRSFMTGRKAGDNYRWNSPRIITIDYDQDQALMTTGRNNSSSSGEYSLLLLDGIKRNEIVTINLPNIRSSNTEINYCDINNCIEIIGENSEDEFYIERLNKDFTILNSLSYGKLPEMSGYACERGAAPLKPIVNGDITYYIAFGAYNSQTWYLVKQEIKAGMVSEGIESNSIDNINCDVILKPNQSYQLILGANGRFDNLVKVEESSDPTDTLATVARTGSYNDLIDKPDLSNIGSVSNRYEDVSIISSPKEFNNSDVPTIPEDYKSDYGFVIYKTIHGRYGIASKLNADDTVVIVDATEEGDEYTSVYGSYSLFVRNEETSTSAAASKSVKFKNSQVTSEGIWDKLTTDSTQISYITEILFNSCDLYTLKHQEWFNNNYDNLTYYKGPDLKVNISYDKELNTNEFLYFNTSNLEEKISDFTFNDKTCIGELEPNHFYKAIAISENEVALIKEY